MQRIRAHSAALCVVATMATAPVLAQDLVGDSAIGEVAFSDETVQLRYRDAGKNVDVGSGSRASAALFLSEERDIVFFGDLLFPGGDGTDRVQLLFGPRVYVALLEDENSDVLSLSLGAEARVEVSSDGKLAVSAQAFYAPDILTFGTADNVTDLSARIEFELQPRLTVFGGMRWFEFELIEEIDGQDERTLQEELFAGISWKF
jgi:YfaZ precursor